ncbi:MAG: RNA pseudouridine synthase [Candidatus Izemoplasmatales bacterium]|jgi:23S rRNA pseudouridine955/2504/2580 synthase|nr:RNA pseudouridine synthase [Candidatus Izemoplasmatales bacterium]
MQTNDNPRVIFENNDILIAYKPIKMLSHPERSLNLPDLLTFFKHAEYRVITRLDVNTSGLVLIAKNQEISSLLNEMSKQNQIIKSYLTICVGYFAKEEETIEAYLLKDSNQGIVRLSLSSIPNSEKITTRYKIIKEANQLSLVEVQLITGKTHQIRAHLALVGHPVLGDPLYGNQRFNQKLRIKTQCLSSHKIKFEMIEKNHPLYYLNGQEYINHDTLNQRLFDKK